ncbi:MAG: hypothetical protein U5L95_04725 [Candidatus Saccharibacteria bacterium]|nr:hypothetical protein [Candidatus Saccharibacteria bacterium]
MPSLLLLLHIASAVALWGFSLKSFFVVRKEQNASVLVRRRARLVLLIIVTAILGSFTALSSGVFTVAVCTKLALYLLPSFVAFYFLQKRLINIKKTIRQ